ncbi:MAG: hypothetical protein NTV11_00035 [Rhodocyclales bacterium]|nr:hypothetical protein [Rhodocyclales bacterium]
MKKLLVVICCLGLMGCDKLKQVDDLRAELNDVRQRLDTVEKAQQRLVEQINAKPTAPAIRWVLWQHDVITTVTIGLSPAPPKPLDAFSDKEECQAAASKLPPKETQNSFAGRSWNSLSFPRNFVFQEMGYNAPANWKEKRS